MEQRRWLVLVVCIAFSTPAATTRAAQVRGKIAGADKLLPEVYTEMAKGEHHYTWREPSPTVKGEFRALTANPSRDICIAAISQGTASPHSDIQITVTGGHTVPTTIAVAPGTKLLFVNHDPFNHHLYLTGDASTFKESDTTPGGSRDWTAPGTGHFEFRDRLAPTLRFFVVIDPGVVEVVYPGHNGTFAFRDLQTGDYFLKAFFQGKQVGKPVQAVATRGNVELREPLTLEQPAP
jgi:plastocyanin